MKKKAKKKKSGDEGVTTSDRKVRRDHFEKLYLRWEQKEIKGIFLYELEEKLALGKKQKNKKTKQCACKCTKKRPWPSGEIGGRQVSLGHGEKKNMRWDAAEK